MAPRTNRADEVAQDRRRRRTFNRNSYNSKFALPPEMENSREYRYHWALNEPGRIPQLIREDWDIVSNEELASADGQLDIGTNLTRFGERDEAGKPVEHVLMRKRWELDAEDQAREQKINDERMAAIKRGAPVTSEGVSTTGPGRSGYIRDMQISDKPE